MNVKKDFDKALLVTAGILMVIGLCQGESLVYVARYLLSILAGLWLAITINGLLNGSNYIVKMYRALINRKQ
ncbi:hypothetical protein GGI1_11808 [Acidithiobacillus sp. GGI-221]|nr:hypothetical protein GGI1_11808 [Acidithiobacillus sp. GGI-221]